MWSTLVIILPPVINDFPGMNDIAEPVLIQAFIAKRPLKLSINPFCVGLPGWISRSSTHAQKPTDRVRGRKLRPLIGSYRRRIAAKQCNAVQNTRDLNA
jgi:hypothetical protein